MQYFDIFYYRLQRNIYVYEVFKALNVMIEKSTDKVIKNKQLTLNAILYLKKKSISNIVEKCYNHMLHILC